MKGWWPLYTDVPEQSAANNINLDETEKEAAAPSATSVDIYQTIR